MKNQRLFLNQLLAVSGNTFSFSTNEKESAKSVFKTGKGKITKAMKDGHVAVNEEKVATFFLENLELSELENWCEKLGFTGAFFDAHLFCVALALEYYSYFGENPNDNNPYSVRDLYKKLYHERNSHAADEINRTFKKSDNSFDEVFETHDVIGAEERSYSVRFTLLCFRHPSINSYYATELVDYLMRNLPPYLGMDIRPDDNKYAAFHAGAKAINKLREKSKDRNLVKNCFGEMMISHILENVMGAPKLFNRVERGTGDDNTEYYESVHLHTYNRDGNAYFQIIIGVSGVNNDLQLSIGKALSLIDLFQSEDGNRKVIDYINNDFLNKDISEDAANVLAKYVLTEDRKLKAMLQGFGVLLAYSPRIEHSQQLEPEEYKEAVLEKMRLDVKDCRYRVDGYVQEQKGILNHPMEFYVLPMEDPDSEVFGLYNAMTGESVV